MRALDDSAGEGGDEALLDNDIAVRGIIVVPDELSEEDKLKEGPAVMSTGFDEAN